MVVVVVGVVVEVEVDGGCAVRKSGSTQHGMVATPFVTVSSSEVVVVVVVVVVGVVVEEEEEEEEEEGVGESEVRRESEGCVWVRLLSDMEVSSWWRRGVSTGHM